MNFLLCKFKSHAWLSAFFLCALCVLSRLNLSAATVVIPLGQIGSAPSTNRSVTITPYSIYQLGQIPLLADRTYTNSDINGNVTVTLPSGTYQVDVKPVWGQIGTTEFYFYVDPSNAVQSAFTNLLTTTPNTFPPPQYAYPAAASDARYLMAPINSNQIGSVNLGQIFPNPGTGSQTPLNEDINSAQYSLTNAGTVAANTNYASAIQGPQTNQIQNQINITPNVNNAVTNSQANVSFGGVAANGIGFVGSGAGLTGILPAGISTSGSSVNWVLTDIAGFGTFAALPPGNTTNLSSYYANLAPGSSTTPAGLNITTTTTNLVALTNSTIFQGPTNIPGGPQIVDQFVDTNIFTYLNSAMGLTNSTITNATILGGSLSNVVVTPNIFYVRSSGNDLTADANDFTRPWLTFTGALANVVSPAIIDLGVGTFWTANTTNGSLIPSNVSVRGQGVNASFLNQANLSLASTNNVNTNCPALVIGGDNIELHDFTLGTNTGQGQFYYPLELSHGTNLFVHDVTIDGDSDCVYGNSLTFANTFSNSVAGGQQPVFFNDNFISGYDTVVLLASPGTGATNSSIGFHNCTFKVVADPNFQDTGSFPSRGIFLEHVTTAVRNCTFSISNVYEAYGIYVQATSGVTNWLTLQNNSISVIGGGTALNTIFVNGADAYTSLVGPFNEDLANFGTSVANPDDAVFGAVNANNSVTTPEAIDGTVAALSALIGNETVTNNLIILTNGELIGNIAGGTNLPHAAISTNGSSSGQVLTSAGGQTVWATPSGGSGGGTWPSYQGTIPALSFPAGATEFSFSLTANQGIGSGARLPIFSTTTFSNYCGNMTATTPWFGTNIVVWLDSNGVPFYPMVTFEGAANSDVIVTNSGSGAYPIQVPSGGYTLVSMTYSNTAGTLPNCQFTHSLQHFP